MGLDMEDSFQPIVKVKKVSSLTNPSLTNMVYKISSHLMKFQSNSPNNVCSCPKSYMLMRRVKSCVFSLWEGTPWPLKITCHMPTL